MRYAIMLQLVAGIAFILVASAALFAWLQYRPGPEQGNNSDINSTERWSAVNSIRSKNLCG